MVQLFRALAAVAGDPGLIPCTHVAGNSVFPSGIGTRQACGALNIILANAHTHKRKAK